MVTASDKFRIEQIAPDLPLTWAVTEKLRWNQAANDALKKDVDGTLLEAAYHSVDWEKHFERLKGTPFHDWAVESGGILTVGGRYHIENDDFFSAIGDISTVQEGYLKEHPEFNQVLHDIHLETAGQMIDFILERAPKGKKKKRRRRRRRRKPSARPEDNVFKTGDSVVVKPGTLDPDFDVDIGGWQGRILEPPSPEGTVLIAWDSVTLKDMPDSVIEQGAEQGLDWSQMGLETCEVEPATPRDTQDDVDRAIVALLDKFAWSWLGEEGRRINEILAGVDPDDEMALLYAWEHHLNEHLNFPFEAEVAEFQERGPLQAGDRVKVTGINLVDDLYGVIVDLSVGRRKYAFPLCDLEVTDARSPNDQLVQDYAVWFANR